MQLCAMPSGLLNQVALPAKLKRAAGKLTYLYSMSMQQLSFINLQILESISITAGKRSMAKLTSHELSNIVKKICLIFTVTDRRLLSQNFSHICCQLTELTPTYSLATPGDLVTTFSTNPRLKCQPGMWSPTSLGDLILNPSYLKNTSAE